VILRRAANTASAMLLASSVKVEAAKPMGGGRPATATPGSIGVKPWRGKNPRRAAVPSSG
jgi:hypothetical protein